MSVSGENVTIGADLNRHYAEHQLPADGGAHEKWFRIRIGPLSIPLPNPPARQQAVFIHDVNHLLTGYNTVFSDGEMSIAAYEVGTGCGRVWVAWLLNLPLMSLGALVRPRAVFSAFARGREADSLYRLTVPRDALRAMTVSDARRMIRLDQSPSTSRGAHLAAFLGWVGPFWLVPLAIVLSW